MKKKLLLSLFGIFLASTLLLPGSFTVVVDGEPSAVVVLPDDAVGSERRAADILVEHLEAMTGVELDVVSASTFRAGRGLKPIWLGEWDRLSLRLPEGNTFAASFGVQEEGIKPQPGGEEEQAILWATPEQVVISGADQAGLRHALYWFLEELGIRYLWPGDLGKVIPRSETLEIDDFFFIQAPVLARRNVRHIYGPSYRVRSSRAETGLDRIDFTPNQFGSLVRDAVATSQLDDGWGNWHRLGARERFHYGHSFGNYWDRFSDLHPEWFALQPNGVRDQSSSPGRPRLCKSNPELIAQVVEDKIHFFEANPNQAGTAIGPNDGGTTSFCLCEACRRLDPPNAPPIVMRDFTRGRAPFDYVSLSDRIVWFSNQIAEQVSEQFPDKHFGFYAYSAYRTPPVREVPHPNLLIVYVGTGNAEVDLEQFDGWAKHGNRMLYRPNTLLANRNAMVPQNFGGRLADFLAYVTANGVVGTDYDSCQNHWALNGMTYYLLARAHWDPVNFDVEAEIRDYCEAGFGPAADLIQEYFMELAEISRESHEEGIDARSLYDEERITKLRGLLTRAADLAERDGDPEVAERVAFLKTGLDFGVLRAELYQLEQSGAHASLREEKAREYQEFLKYLTENHTLAVNTATAAFRSTTTLRMAD